MKSQSIKTIDQVFKRNAEIRGANECVTVYPFGQSALTCAELYALLLQKSRVFSDEFGLKSGDTVALLADNSLEYLVLTFSAVFAGVKVMLISTKTAAVNLPYFLEQSDSKMLFRSDGFNDFVEQALAQEKRFDAVRRQDLSAFSREQSGAPALNSITPPQCNENATALILHTSGSTAKPKLVHLSHKNILGNQVAASSRIASFWTEQEVSFSWLPLFHAYGLLGEFMVDMFVGGRFILFDKPENMGIDHIIKGLRDTGASVFCTVPWMLEAIREKIETEERHNREAGKTEHKSATLEVVEALKFMVTAGSPLPLKVGEFYTSNNIVVISSFGMTEAAGSFLFSDYEEMRPDIVYPVSNAGVQFVANQQSGADKELVFIDSDIISSSTAEDYYNQGPSENSEGCFFTGDLFHEFNAGWRYISRKDHIFNSLQGEKVNPVHFEARLEQLESVDRVWVFGENRAFNTAYVELKSGLTAQENIPELQAEILEYVQQEVNPLLEMPARVYPNDVIFLPAGEKLPRTAKGNVDRKKAAELFANRVLANRVNERPGGTLSPGTRLSPAQLRDVVLTEAEKYLQAAGNKAGLIAGSDQHSLLELGFDSLMLMSLKNSLEVKLGVRIPTELVFSFPTLQDFTARIHALQTDNDAAASDDGDYANDPEAQAWHNILLEQVPYHTAYYKLPYSTFNVTMSLIAPHKVSREELEAAIRKLERRNSMLRSVYTEAGKFRILDRSFVQEACFDELVMTGSHNPYENQELRNTINSLQNIRVDFQQGPVYRYALVHIDDGNEQIRSLVYFELNHIATDFYGLNLIMQQLMGYLQANNEDARQIQDDGYVHHIPVADETSLQRYSACWQKIFMAPRPPARNQGDPTLGGARQFSFHHIDLDSMARLLAGHRITLFNGLYTAWILALTRCIPDLRLDKFYSITPLSMRHSAAIENMVGCFLELAPLTFTLNADETLKQIMLAVQQTTTRAFQDILSDRVAYLEQITNDESNLVSVVERNIFLYRTQAEIMQPKAGWDFYRNEFFSDRSQPGLTLDICADPASKGVEGYIRFNFNYCRADLVEEIVDEFENLLLEILASPALDTVPGEYRDIHVKAPDITQSHLEG